MTTNSTNELIKLVSAITPALATTALSTSSAIDRNGYKSAVLAVETGETSGTPDSFTAVGKIWHCATSGGTYTAYTSNEQSTTLTTVATASTLVTRAIDLTGAYRYIKVEQARAFVGGTTPKVNAHCYLVLGASTDLPTA